MNMTHSGKHGRHGAEFVAIVAAGAISTKIQTAVLAAICEVVWAITIAPVLLGTAKPHCIHIAPACAAILLALMLVALEFTTLESIIHYERGEK